MNDPDNKVFTRKEQAVLRQELRNNLTTAEVTLWNILRRKQIDGLKFRRQHSVGEYIMDFYCPEQFEILGASESEGKGFSNGLWKEESGIAQPLVKGEKIYKRLFIKQL